MKEEVRDQAIQYGERGYKVLPLYPIGPNGNCTCSRTDACSSPGKHPFTPLVSSGVKDATDDPEIIDQWWNEYSMAGIGIATGKRSGIVAVDVDGDQGENSWGELINGTQINTPVSKTGNGKHILFKAPDQEVKNRTGIKQKIDVRGDGGYIVAPPTEHHSGQQYQWHISPDEIDPQPLPGAIKKLLKEPSNGDQNQNTSVEKTIEEGVRNKTLTSIAGTMRNRGLTLEEMLPSLQKVNERRCSPSMNPGEVRQLAESVSSYEPGDFSISDLQDHFGEDNDWPDPIGDEGYHGVAGDIVKAMQPHTESDPAAIMFSLLSGFGNLVGPNCYSMVEGDKHPLRIWPVLVGKTSKARKGVSWNLTKNLLAEIDPSWHEREKNGLRTGAGFVHHVRDPDGDDSGVEDKRLTVVEGEFSSVLRSMSMDGNTLSPLIRKAWDLGPEEVLQKMTKSSPDKSTGAHVSLIGHITERELKKYLTSTEAGNGFGNRFLWVCVKRSKELPFGGDLDQVDFSPMIDEVQRALNYSKGVTSIDWGEDAKPLWEQEYSRLSEGNPGIIGAVTSRSEAYVLRIASIFAILDCSATIHEPHLKAALELWRYCRESAFHVFGKKTGNQLADRIRKIVFKNRDGVSRSELSDKLGRNKKKKEIDEALGILKGLDHVYEKQVETKGAPKTLLIPSKTPYETTKKTK